MGIWEHINFTASEDDKCLKLFLLNCHVEKLIGEGIIKQKLKKSLHALCWKKVNYAFLLFLLMRTLDSLVIFIHFVEELPSRNMMKTIMHPYPFSKLKVLGHPTLEKWPTLASLPHWHNDVQHIQEHKYENTGLHGVVPLSPKSASFDLLSKMLEYDPRKRITAAQAIEHDYFRSEPLPGRNALVPSQPGEKVINYPTRPVDTNTDFEGTTSLQPPQPVSSGNAVSGGMPGAHGINNRSAARPLSMGMQRMQAQGMAAYNLSSQAGMGGGMNPGNIPMPRGVAQAHQQHHLRRKDPPGTGTGYPPQQKSRR